MYRFTNILNDHWTHKHDVNPLTTLLQSWRHTWPWRWVQSHNSYKRIDLASKYLRRSCCRWVYHYCIPVTDFSCRNTVSSGSLISLHDDVMTWKRNPNYWPSVRGPTGNGWVTLTKGQYCGSLRFSLLSAWTTCCTHTWVVHDFIRRPKQSRGFIY